MVSNVPPVISTMHRSPAAGGVIFSLVGEITGRRLLSSANRLGQMTVGCGDGIFDHQGV